MTKTAAWHVDAAYIDGAFVKPAGTEVVESVDPATGAPITSSNRRPLPSAERK